MSEERPGRPPGTPDAADGKRASVTRGGPDDILAEFLRVAEVVPLGRARRRRRAEGRESGR